MALIPVERVLKRVPAYFPFTGVSLVWLFFKFFDLALKAYYLIHR